MASNILLLRKFTFPALEKGARPAGALSAPTSGVAALHLFNGPVNKKSCSARRVHKTLKTLGIDCVSLRAPRDRVNRGDSPFLLSFLPSFFFPSFFFSSFFFFFLLPSDTVLGSRLVGSSTRENSVVGVGDPASRTRRRFSSL